MPVVGDPETVNNTYIDQVVSGAKAAIDKAVEMGVTDRNRVGVGGHSYGAFMTANLLAHSDLFRAGIARSGAYNRTLTPFGFQSERRTLWEAPELYVKVSPFLHAHKINEPLLLIHGTADTLIPTRASQELFDRAGDPKALWLAPNAGHDVNGIAEIYPTELADRLDGFLREYFPIQSTPAPSTAPAN